MYDFKIIEKKWQNYWEKNKTFVVDTKDFRKPKFYCLGMFPYPSGQGLHVGHPEGYTANDIISRMKRMQGYNVLNPMGFDSFGLPAEQYAIKTGNPPQTFTEKNIETFISQLKSCGFSFDWTKTISTSDPSYYKWTQWIFKQLYLDGYARQVNIPVNWCEELGTVLANDEVINGKSERGGFPVIKKEMKQWILDISKYADRLLEGLNDLDWPESTKEMQKNWIGKSEGAEVTFNIEGLDEKLTVFTTRPDTLFGVTFMVVAPEHELLSKINSNNIEIKKYQEFSSSKTDLERTYINKDKTGIFTGLYAINPVNNQKVPIWTSDYVLSTYGSGAIMAVPAHDQRDYEFAKKFNIPIIEVIKGGNISNEAYTDDGVMINSNFLNGLSSKESISAMIKWLKDNKCGDKKITYKLHDWIFARQRYWGEPIPIVHFEDGTTDVLSDDKLPLILPQLNNYLPGKNGEPPLEKAADWVNVEINGKKGKLETTTMPGSAGSSWYFLRYIDPNNDNVLADHDLMKHWLPVDLYIGGAEHAVGHLLYSRFWANYLYDKGIITVKEPFKKLFHIGMILGENGEKMSKSRGNVINPDEIINKFGADTLRIYEMFLGPLEAEKPWNEKGLVGSKRFLDRVWRLYIEDNIINDNKNITIEKLFHQTVKKVTEDYENLKFNTAISQMMIFVNEVTKIKSLPRDCAEGFIKLLNPVAPHITEEIWQVALRHDKTIVYESWPSFEIDKAKDKEINLSIQINGKFRTSYKLIEDKTEEEILKEILQLEIIKKYLIESKIEHTIYIPGKVLNILTTKN